MRAPGSPTLKTRVFAVFVEVQADDLAMAAREREVRLSADEHDVAEPAHRDIGRLRAAERRDLPVLDEYVVQGEQ